MDNLVIGNTSQLSYYFPDNYLKISSRNIDFKSLSCKKWNRVFICIGESRKFLKDDQIYDDVNFHLTIKIVNFLKFISNSIIIYSTCELWNQYDGQVDISMDFNFYSTSYLQSKYKLSKYIMDNGYSNVFILYPFNFNSIYRSNDFLFGKIFDSIVNNKVIEIGDTYYYRDIIHPKYVVESSISADRHMLIGSGRLTFVNDFIRDLYNYYGMDYNEYVIENYGRFSEYEKRKEYYLRDRINHYPYVDLLKDTVMDINKLKNMI